MRFSTHCSDGHYNGHRFSLHENTSRQSQGVSPAYLAPGKNAKRSGASLPPPLSVASLGASFLPQRYHSLNPLAFSFFSCFTIYLYIPKKCCFILLILEVWKMVSYDMEYLCLAFSLSLVRLRTICPRKHMQLQCNHFHYYILWDCNEWKQIKCLKHSGIQKALNRTSQAGSVG